MPLYVSPLSTGLILLLYGSISKTGSFGSEDLAIMNWWNGMGLGWITRTWLRTQPSSYFFERSPPKTVSAWAAQPFPFLTSSARRSFHRGFTRSPFFVMSLIMFCDVLIMLLTSF